MRACLTILSLALLGHALLAQDVRVLVLDALDGKPQRGAKVYSLCQGPLRNSRVDVDLTDTTGVATIEYLCKDDEKLHLSVIALPKEQCGEPSPLTLQQITSVGSIVNPKAPGMSCSRKISRKLSPVPGQVTIFIKKPSWWQAHFED